MKKTNIKKMEKIVGAFAFVAAIIGSTSCLAHGCPTSCVHEVQKVVVSEPACAAEVPTQIGTAVRYEQNGDTAVLTIMGSKEEVLLDWTKAKRKAISEGQLVFTQVNQNVDTNEMEAKLVMKKNQQWYNGFVKSIVLDGNFDKVTEKIGEFQENGYKVVDFTGSGFFYEDGGKAEVELVKKF